MNFHIIESPRESRILQSAMPDVIGSIAPLEGCIAGGALTSVFSSRQIADWDVFPQSRHANENIQAKRDRISEPAMLTDSARSYNIDSQRVQLITIPEVWGPPEHVIGHFDWTCCQCAWTPKSDGFLMADRFLRDLSQRRLVYCPGLWPIASLFRAVRYLNRGYRIGGAEVLKLGLTIQQLRIDSWQDLIRQMMGIDVLFLKPLTDALSERTDPFSMADAMAFIESTLDDLLEGRDAKVSQPIRGSFVREGQ